MTVHSLGLMCAQFIHVTVHSLEHCKGIPLGIALNTSRSNAGAHVRVFFHKYIVEALSRAIYITLCTGGIYIYIVYTYYITINFYIALNSSNVRAGAPV